MSRTSRRRRASKRDDARAPGCGRGRGRGAVTPREHVDRGAGLRVRVAASVRAGVYDPGGEPFALEVGADGALAFAFCDGTGDWGDGLLRSRGAAAVLARALAGGGREPIGRLRAAVDAGDRELCRREPVVVHEGGDEWNASCFAFALLVDAGRAFVAWLGDAPLVLVRDSRVERLTPPRLLVDELIAAGQMTRAQANASPLRNIAVSALGGHELDAPPSRAPEIAGPILLRAGDCLLACYDRVADVLADHDFCAFAAHPPELAVAALLDAARARGIAFEVAAAAFAFAGAPPR
jgi:serine/threonine protein phosphatase PrpC